MSESPTERRIVLLGKNGSEKSAVGNFILDTVAFDLNCVQNHCERARGHVEGRHIAVINTPDLLDPHISHDKLSEELRWCVTLSKPGPHVFLLVLQPDRFTQEEGDRIRTILHTLSERSFDYSMVLTTHEDKRGHMDEDHPLNQMVRSCRGRQHLIHLSDHTQLMADVDKIVKENGGDYLTCEVFEDSSSGMVQGIEEIHRSKTDGSLKSPSEEELGKEQGLVSLKEERRKPSSRHDKLSPLRILLLGKSDDKTTVGNMILQRKAFFNYKQPCESASGKVKGKSVTVVKTPDFFAPPLTVEFLMKEMEKCKSLSAPGPHGVLLVLKPEVFTEENRNTFKLILSIFGKESFKHSMVIITHHKGVAGNPHLRQIIEECGGRHHEMYKQGSDHKELTEKIEEMVEENEWRYLTSNEERTHDIMTPKAQRLNVVLCGRRGAGKTSIANVILGQTESSPKSSSSSVCVKREGEVCGRPVTLIELPALYRTHLTQEEVMRETFHCVSLCDSGIHAFLLVVPLGPLTDEDKGELETIQKILSSRVNDFIMVLFRQDNIPVDKTAVDFVEQDADTKQLIKICGGRYKIFDALKIDNAKQMTELVAEIVKMMDQNRTCYTLYMYVKAQDLRANEKLETQKRRIVDLEEKIITKSKFSNPEAQRRNSVDLLPPKMSESPTGRRIVLLGKNGSEKSAVGNFILEREAFDLNCVQNHCERARGHVEGRHIAVINTPDLLDLHISHDKLSEELRWCVTLSKPGPHVFLLVLQPDEFTQEEGDRIRTILHTLSERSFDYSMVLTTHEDKRGHMDEDHPLNQMVRACRGRQHLSDHTQLMADVDKIVKENGGDYLTCDVFEDTTSDMVQGKEEIHRSKTDWSLKSSSEEELGKDVLEQEESAKLDNWGKVREIGLTLLKENLGEQSHSGEKCESQLRIVLLGRSDDKKKTVGNIILQQRASPGIGLPAGFLGKKKQCESASGKLKGKSVTVVKTPDFFALTVESLMQEMEKCKSLSAPGPHGVLLVLKPEEFTEENRNTFKLILNIFGKEAFKHSMVIITHHKGVTGNPHLRQMIEECGGRHHEIYTQGSDHKELTEKIEKMVEENEWRYLTSNEETTHDTMTPKAQILNVVLCGRRGAGKTSTANVILGQTESSPKSSSSSVCVKREGEVCGRPVTLIELPALYGTHLTQEEVMRETFHCVSLCDSGVNAFLLVVPLGPLTDEDKGELETIQKILSSRVNYFFMVLFRQDNIPVDKTAVDFVEQNADTKQLIKICGGRYKIFDALKIENAKQTTELIAEIVKMMDQNRTCYTLYMYMEAKHQSELEEKNTRIKDLEERIRNMSQGEFVEHREEQILGGDWENNDLTL
ncbi:uncharacterized protein ACWYII_018892 [Salvelinus alpinus]